MAEDEPWHGGSYGYTKRKCREPKCRAWWNAYQARYRIEREARTGEAFSGRLGGWVPGKPCACGCGRRVPVASRTGLRKGHRKTLDSSQSEG